MSYILEALKKAEAERKGGAQPAAPLLPPFVTSSRHPPAWRRPLPSAGLAALAITLASAAWYAVTREDTAPALNKPAAAVPAHAMATVMPPQGAVPREETVPPPAAEPEPERVKEKVAPKKAAETGGEKSADKKQTRKPEEARAAVAATPPEPAVGPLRDLPEQVQREIPALSVAGYIYSGNKADRSVLINNRLLREGDEVTPGHVLEKMTPSGMVFNYKGYRYRRGY